MTISCIMTGHKLHHLLMQEDAQAGIEAVTVLHQDSPLLGAEVQTGCDARPHGLIWLSIQKGAVFNLLDLKNVSCLQSTDL